MVGVKVRGADFVQDRGQKAVAEPGLSEWLDRAQRVSLAAEISRNSAPCSAVESQSRMLENRKREVVSYRRTLSKQSTHFGLNPPANEYETSCFFFQVREAIFGGR